MAAEVKALICVDERADNWDRRRMATSADVRPLTCAVVKAAICEVVKPEIALFVREAI